MRFRSQDNKSLFDSILLLCALLVLLFVSYRFGQWMSLDESPRKEELLELHTTNLDSSDQWIETVSWNPRISIYHNFLTPDQCDRLVHLFEDDLKESGIKSILGTFVSQQYENEPLLVELNKKISEWSHVPTAHGENFYFWKYVEGDFYPPHRDVILNPEHTGVSGERIASVFIYLNTPDGGSLQFPDASPAVTIHPKKGNAVLLWNLKSNGEEDPKSTHTTTPVKTGVKYTLTKWLRQKKFQ
eukprot:TRINITY_DN1573_c0_g1_i1.p1 TRINITY_DN1573_c0_g1~~TRINITY_DN1573_c0_g1_i1.p1  ORF type:complete len:243 (-),score=44.21 TRINITY_DN1573_c0_g1_i1:17-745(-)